jgi:general secretion pathway protein L
LPDGVLPKLAVTVAAGNGVNLLQGQYGKKTEYGSLFMPWKTAAIMLLTLGIIAMALKGLGYYQLQQDEAALRAQFNTEYRLIRPNDSREIVDPVATVISLRRSVGGSVAPQVFLPGLRELGAAIAANSTAEIETISYRAGVIDLRLTVPNVTTLDNIQKAVSSSGRFQAKIQSTDQVADRINGRIQIQESGL